MPVTRQRPWGALLLGGALAAAAQAQTPRADSDAPPPPVPGQVLSDAQPLPAEDRDSTGALLMDQHPASAQQRAAPPAAAPVGVAPNRDRDISRLVERTRSWDDVREAESTQVPPGEASGAPPELPPEGDEQ